MRRNLLMVALALAATLLPVPAVADDPGSTHRSRAEAPAGARRIPTTLGGVPCSLIPVPAAEDPAPVGSGTCPGVRPGGRVVTTIADCTLNFLFQAPDGTRYMGTAGHCVDPGQETTFKDSDVDGKGRIERVWAWGSGPVAMDSTGQRFGEFVYAVVYDPKDFALVRLDPGVAASPEMCHFGAPRGVSATNATTNTMGAVVLQYYGNAAGVGDVAPARSAVALGTPDPDHIYAAGLALPGDSGAGVMTSDGMAVGVLVTTGYQIPGPGEFPQANEKGVDVGTMGITRLGPQLARAAEKLGVTLELVTAG